MIRKLHCKKVFTISGLTPPIGVIPASSVNIPIFLNMHYLFCKYYEPTPLNNTPKLNLRKHSKSYAF